MPDRGDLPPPVEDLAVREGVSAAELVEALGRAGGFTAKKVAQAAQTFVDMRRSGMTVILSFPAALVATGARGVIRDMVRRRAVDALVTTCGTLDHDLARLWKTYHRGEFEMDDVDLARRGIHRLGSVLVPEESYGAVLEEKLQPILADLHARKAVWGPRELVHAIAGRLAGEPRREESILWWCHERGVPVFVPGITDGAVGAQAWLFREKHRDFVLDVLADERELSDLVHRARGKLGALMLGGGISKHHVIWWAQFARGLDAAVYVTTAPEWDGSLSGARLREAISWGKLKEGARHVTIEGDATLVLPLLWAASVGRLPPEPVA
ncbi:MAG TPA: deoxyhypusine synthase [Candidatus Thermoplasmatota archaeon]|nr:deoxyhypusine synthase [Candidatus Thermoplasmatota archaeon]